METSVLVAKVLSVLYLSVSLGVLFSWKYYQKAFQEITRNAGFVLLSGFIAMSLGVVILAYHNIWTDDWTSIITVIGWIALIKGFWLIVSPREISLFAAFMEAKFSRWIILLLTLSLGALFAWFGFFQGM